MIMQMMMGTGIGPTLPAPSQMNESLISLTA